MSRRRFVRRPTSGRCAGRTKAHRSTHGARLQPIRQVREPRRRGAMEAGHLVRLEAVERSLPGGRPADVTEVHRHGRGSFQDGRRHLLRPRRQVRIADLGEPPDRRGPPRRGVRSSRGSSSAWRTGGRRRRRPSRTGGRSRRPPEPGCCRGGRRGRARGTAEASSAAARSPTNGMYAHPPTSRIGPRPILGVHPGPDPVVRQKAGEHVRVARRSLVRHARAQQVIHRERQPALERGVDRQDGGPHRDVLVARSPILGRRLAQGRTGVGLSASRARCPRRSARGRASPRAPAAAKEAAPRAPSRARSPSTRRHDHRRPRARMTVPHGRARCAGSPTIRRPRPASASAAHARCSSRHSGSVHRATPRSSSFSAISRRRTASRRCRARCPGRPGR